MVARAMYVVSLINVSNCCDVSTLDSTLPNILAFEGMQITTYGAASRNGRRESQVEIT